VEKLLKEVRDCLGKLKEQLARTGDNEEALHLVSSGEKKEIKGHY
jgi:hypothetical protein